MELGVDEKHFASNLNVSILDVRRGSVIVDYTLSANNELLIENALSNMNASMGQSMEFGNLTFIFSSNSVLTLSPTDSPTALPTLSS